MTEEPVLNEQTRATNGFNNPRWNNGPLFRGVFGSFPFFPLAPVIFFLMVRFLLPLLLLLFIYRIVLIRIYGFRPNWEETDPGGSVIVEALSDDFFSHWKILLMKPVKISKRN